MARYMLILRDIDYVRLVTISRMQRKSLGKLLNEIIRDWLEKEVQEGGGEAASPECELCGDPADYQVLTKANRKLFMCKACFSRISTVVIRGYKTLKDVVEN